MISHLRLLRNIFDVTTCFRHQFLKKKENKSCYLFVWEEAGGVHCVLQSHCARKLHTPLACPPSLARDDVFTRSFVFGSTSCLEFSSLLIAVTTTEGSVKFADFLGDISIYHYHFLRLSFVNQIMRKVRVAFWVKVWIYDPYYHKFGERLLSVSQRITNVLRSYFNTG